jgi:hypothetical protein
LHRKNGDLGIKSRADGKRKTNSFAHVTGRSLAWRPYLVVRCFRKLHWKSTSLFHLLMPQSCQPATGISRRGLSIIGRNFLSKRFESYNKSFESYNESAVPVWMKRSSKITKETKDIYKIINIKGDRDRTILLLKPTGLTLGLESSVFSSVCLC